MRQSYAIAVRGAVPDDIVPRVSAAHASAVLQRQAASRPAEDDRNVPEHGETNQQEVRDADVQMP